MRIKSSLKLLTAALMFLCFSTNVLASPVEVGKASTFINCLKNNQDMQLVADIDLSSFDNMVDNYTGEISGLNVNAKRGDPLYFTIKNCKHMLAHYMNGAKIHNIAFVDCKVHWGMYTNIEGEALLCAKSTNCEFREILMVNVQIEGRRESELEALSEYRNGACLTANDVGSTFKSVNAAACRAYVADKFAGIFCSHSTNSEFISCNTNAYCAVYSGGFISDSGCGGFCGEATGSTFTDCNNMATVSAKNDRVGGIIGYGTDCDFYHCNNFGPVLQTSVSSLDALQASVPFGTILGLVGGTIGGQASTLSIYHFINTQSTASVEIVDDMISLNDESLDAGEIADIQAGIDDELQVRLNINSQYVSGLPQILSVVGVALAVYQIGKLIYDSNESDEAGGIVGNLEGGTISCCANYAWVACPDCHCGGIVGIAQNSDNRSVLIADCLNQGVVQGNQETGGIAGTLDSGTIQSCLNVGNVNGTESSTYGIICGSKADGAIVKNCFVSGKTTATGTDYGTFSQLDLASGEATCLLNEKSGSAVWHQTLGTDPFPTLNTGSNAMTRSQINSTIDPTITTDNAFTFMSALSNPYSSIKLSGDIDLQTNSFNLSSARMPFCGSIDGQGHRIKNVAYTLKQIGKSNHNQNQDDVALLPYAENASFSNIELSDFNIYPGGLDGSYIAMLVAHSKNCNYQNVKLTGKSGFVTDGEKNFLSNSIANLLDRVWDYATVTHACYMGGLVAESTGDTFTDCSVGSNCTFLTNGSTFYSGMLGGLTGTSSGSKYIHCVNEASLIADDDKVGGIVGESTGTTFYGCLNGGKVQGDEYLGGIVGSAVSSDILFCTNVGEINCLSSVDYNAVGGIAGAIDTSTGHTVDWCFNYGNIVSDADAAGIVGSTDRDGAVLNSSYYCSRNGSAITNMESDEIANLQTGEYTFGFNNGEKGNSVGAYAQTYDNDYTSYSRLLFQSIDNNAYFTHYPVPIAAAGTVNPNKLCDGTRMYSNKYMYDADDATHTSQPNKFGICTLCGNAVATEAVDVSISNAADMRDFAYAVNKGVPFGNVVLTNDIDLSDGEWLPIGSKSAPFTGAFHGYGHRIKNMIINKADGPVGFFAYLGNGAVIANLVIDSTCVVRSAGLGVAAFVGAIDTTEGSTCSVTITNCGNEAYVSGSMNVGAFIGGVYTNTSTEVNISNCYNTGNIGGSTESAEFVGFAKNHTHITSSWNSGVLKGVRDGASFMGKWYSEQSDCTTANCFDVNSNTQSGITQISADEITSGSLCYTLDPKNTLWYQRIGTDSHPMLSNTNGIRVYKEDYTLCDGTTGSTYVNTQNSVPVHAFDANGFCYRVDGETHYEEPAIVDNKWQIKNAGNLIWIAQSVNAGGTQYDCELVNDITVNSNVLVDGALASNTDDFLSWPLIGNNEAYCFTKSFNGNGHSISGLYVNEPTTTTVAGLFGYVKGDVQISNCIIKDSYFYNIKAAGSFVGIAEADDEGNSVKITNCGAANYVKGYMTGGIIGEVSNQGFTATDLSNCWSIGIAAPYNSSTAAYCDGIVGYVTKYGTNKITATLTDCYYRVDNATGTASYGTSKTASAFTAGEVCSLLNSANPSKKWSQAIDSESMPSFGDAGITYNRKVSSYYGTLVLPFEVESDDNIKYFTIDYIDNTNTLHLKSVESVSANTPCFFKVATECDQLSVSAPTSTVYTVEPTPVVACENNGTSVNFVGTYATQAISPSESSSNYFIALDQLWQGEVAFTLPDYRAYIQIPVSGAKYASCLFIADPEDEAAMIGEISDGKITFYNDKIYNLSGQKLSSPQKGQINIINGKKVLIR